MVDVILNSLKWLGLNWDEGPYFQSQRFPMYRDAAMKLMEDGKAYRCFCKPEEINARREAGMKAKGSWKYERLCLNLSPQQISEKVNLGEPHAIRFLVPQGRTAFQDLVHGEISLDNESVEDFVLLRSDGFPTYHLSVVVDDIDMRITQVIRGDDHISNTPKQIMLYNAFEKPAPRFGHLPLILGPDKKRLSKRHGSVAVEEYQSQGILPEALLNFLALLGWNPGDEREIMSKEELTQEFDLHRVNSSNAVFDMKKLNWMNGKYLSSVPLERMLEVLPPYMEEKSWMDDPEFPKRVDLMRTRALSLVDLVQILAPFYKEDFPYDPAGFEKFKKDPSLPGLIEDFIPVLSGTEPWERHALESNLRAFLEPRGVKAAALIHPIRLALTGKTVGPGLFEVVELMGKEKTIVRLKRFASLLRA
jgi:glutamyl-tRNA synthetase